jgi:hypothetical protein
MTRFLLVTVFLLSWSWQALANEVVAEGRATIDNGDVPGARELATRRAIARAVESQGAVVNGQTLISPGVALESAQVRATGCATQTTPISEVMRGNEISVFVSVSVTNNGACTPVCRRTTLNKIAVTAFAMEFPEQLLMTENGSVAALSAVEIARFINRRNHLPAVFDSRFFPYSSPSQAPQQYGGSATQSLSTAHFAQEHSAQYVLAGVYRDFGISGRARRIEIEAFLHDGANGAVLARRTFSRTAEGNSLEASLFDEMLTLSLSEVLLRYGLLFGILALGCELVPRVAVLNHLGLGVSGLLLVLSLDYCGGCAHGHCCVGCIRRKRYWETHISAPL